VGSLASQWSGSTKPDLVEYLRVVLEAYPIDCRVSSLAEAESLLKLFNRFVAGSCKESFCPKRRDPTLDDLIPGWSAARRESRSAGDAKCQWNLIKQRLDVGLDASFLETGPPHAKEFTTKLQFHTTIGSVEVEGYGGKRKESEIAAYHALLAVLDEGQWIRDLCAEGIEPNPGPNKGGNKGNRPPPPPRPPKKGKWKQAQAMQVKAKFSEYFDQPAEFDEKEEAEVKVEVVSEYKAAPERKKYHGRMDNWYKSVMTDFYERKRDDNNGPVFSDWFWDPDNELEIMPDFGEADEGWYANRRLVKETDGLFISVQRNDDPVPYNETRYVTSHGVSWPPCDPGKWIAGPFFYPLLEDRTSFSKVDRATRAIVRSVPVSTNVAVIGPRVIPKAHRLESFSHFERDAPNQPLEHDVAEPYKAHYGLLGTSLVIFDSHMSGNALRDLVHQDHYGGRMTIVVMRPDPLTSQILSVADPGNNYNVEPSVVCGVPILTIKRNVQRFKHGERRNHIINLAQDVVKKVMARAVMRRVDPISTAMFGAQVRLELLSHLPNLTTDELRSVCDLVLRGLETELPPMVAANQRLYDSLQHHSGLLRETSHLMGSFTAPRTKIHEAVENAAEALAGLVGPATGHSQNQLDSHARVVANEFANAMTPAGISNNILGGIRNVSKAVQGLSLPTLSVRRARAVCPELRPLKPYVGTMQSNERDSKPCDDPKDRGLINVFMPLYYGGKQTCPTYMTKCVHAERCAVANRQCKVAPTQNSSAFVDFRSTLKRLLGPDYTKKMSWTPLPLELAIRKMQPSKRARAIAATADERLWNNTIPLDIRGFPKDETVIGQGFGAVEGEGTEAYWFKELPGADTRFISAQDPVTSTYMSVIKPATEVAKNLFDGKLTEESVDKDHFFAALGRTPRHIGAWVQWHMERGWQAYDVDGSRYDGTRRFEHHFGPDGIRTMYLESVVDGDGEWAGTANPWPGTTQSTYRKYLKRLFRGMSNCYGNIGSTKFDAQEPRAMLSGLKDTSATNTLNIALDSISVFREAGASAVHVMSGGDDVVVFVKEKDLDLDVIQNAYAKRSTDAEVRKVADGRVEFYSGHFIDTEQGMIWTPKIGRVLVKSLWVRLNGTPEGDDENVAIAVTHSVVDSGLYNFGADPIGASLAIGVKQIRYKASKRTRAAQRRYEEDIAHKQITSSTVPSPDPLSVQATADWYSVDLVSLMELCTCLSALTPFTPTAQAVFERVCEVDGIAPGDDWSQIPVGRVANVFSQHELMQQLDALEADVAAYVSTHPELLEYAESLGFQDASPVVSVIEEELHKRKHGPDAIIAFELNRAMHRGLGHSDLIAARLHRHLADMPMSDAINTHLAYNAFAEGLVPSAPPELAGFIRAELMSGYDVVAIWNKEGQVPPCMARGRAKKGPVAKALKAAGKVATGLGNIAQAVGLAQRKAKAKPKGIKKVHADKKAAAHSALASSKRNPITRQNTMGVRIRHTERVQRIVSSAGSVIYMFKVTPVSDLWPILSSYAIDFNHWKGTITLIYQPISTTYNAGSLGSFVIAHCADPDQGPPGSFDAVVNLAGARAFTAQQHIRIDPPAMRAAMYVDQPNDVSAEPRFTTNGVFYLATTGASTVQAAGDIYVSYDIEFTNFTDSTVTSQVSYLVSGNASNTHPFGTSRSIYGGTIASATSGTVTLASTRQKHFICIYSMRTSPASVFPSFSLSGAVMNMAQDAFSMLGNGLTFTSVGPGTGGVVSAAATLGSGSFMITNSTNGIGNIVISATLPSGTTCDRVEFWVIPCSQLPVKAVDAILTDDEFVAMCYDQLEAKPSELKKIRDFTSEFMQAFKRHPELDDVALLLDRAPPKYKEAVNKAKLYISEEHKDEDKDLFVSSVLTIAKSEGWHRTLSPDFDQYEVIDEFEARTIVEHGA